MAQDSMNKGKTKAPGLLQVAVVIFIVFVYFFLFLKTVLL